MCLIVFGYKAHKNYPLILAGNRDEFYDRPAKSAHFWNTEPPLLAGRDLKAGGTWLGISRKGVLGAITNYRDLTRPAKGEKSRGAIIPEFLKHEFDLKNVLQPFIDHGELYNGFNLIAGDTESLFYLSNITNHIERLNPGCYGISNAFLNTPWPKVNTAKKKFNSIISSDKIDEEAVFNLLQNRKTYPEPLLPETGLTPEMEKAVSSIFIETEDYGTRCSTLLMIDNMGEVTFIERTYPNGKRDSEIEKRFEFEIE